MVDIILIISDGLCQLKTEKHYTSRKQSRGDSITNAFFNTF
jgi:hypothetical protein